MEKTNFLAKLFNLALALWALFFVALSCAFVFAYDTFIGFLESKLTSNGTFSNPSAVVITIYLLLISVGLSLILLKGALVYAINKPSFASMQAHIKTYYLVTITTFLGCFILKPIEVVYGEDGILENITVLLSFGASFIFLFLATRYKNILKRLVLFAMFTVFFLFAMEEISWGQRIIGWETTAYMREKNVQQENNLHNLFNEYFPILYIIVTGVMSAVFFYRSQLLKWFQGNFFFKAFVGLIPAADFFYAGYFYLFLLLYTLTLDRGGETLEIILSLTVFFYAYNLLAHYRSRVNLEGGVYPEIQRVEIRK